MNSARVTVVYLLIMLTTSSFPQTKGWRGIVPLHSTCDDAKRLLGISKCETNSYDFEDERAFIWFSEKACLDGWNVPAGTVTSIEVYPKQKFNLGDLGIDVTKFKKEVSQGEYESDRYVDEDQGLIIAANPDGEVKSIAYIPAARDNYLRSPNSLPDQPTGGGDPDSIFKFDEYGDLAIDKEHERLGDFALQLRNEPNTLGYIIAYAGRHARAGEAEARAVRAKNYLVKTYRIEKVRIVTVNGGYRRDLTVELFVGAKDAAPIPSPTICPGEARIIKNRKVGKDRHRLFPSHYRLLRYDYDWRGQLTRRTPLD